MSIIRKFSSTSPAFSSSGGGTVYYTYDAAGQRTRKVWEKSPGTIEERIYFRGFEIFRRRDGTGAVTLERETLHVMDNSRRIVLVDTKTVDSDAPLSTPSALIRFQYDNHLGSAALELDETAAIISYEEYYPYGATSYQAVRSSTEVSSKRYRYTGKERDEETGLYYHGARYYAPWLGRWTRPDPRELVDGPNVYQFTSGNPVRYVDADGTQQRLPKVEPFREGMMIGDYPGMSSRWKQAVDKTLRSVYGGGTYEENMARFQRTSRRGQEARIERQVRGSTLRGACSPEPAPSSDSW